MGEAGYDTRGMHDLLVILEQQSQGGRTPEFFSTHPDPGNRLARVNELIAHNPSKGTHVGADRFQQNVLQYMQ
jgi:predicted Zn-dependent protease